MVAIPHEVTRSELRRPPRLSSSELARFMTYVVERSDLSHGQAYRMSRVFLEMRLTLFTQQRAAFDRIAEHRATMVSDRGWDQSLRQWISIENQARADRSEQHGVDVEYLPMPRALISTSVRSQR